MTINLHRVRAPNPYDHLPVVAAMAVTSSDISEGKPLDVRHTGRAGVSPHLAWSGVPRGTLSVAVTCFDPDAPTPSGFWHWVLFGLDPGVSELPRDAGRPGAVLPPGAVSLRNDAGIAGFAGALPPPGDPAHRYLFAVHALDSADLPIDATATPAYASFQMVFHTLARGLLAPVYAAPAS